MSIPLNATIARLKPPRDKQALFLVSCICGNPVGNGLLARTVLVIVFIPLLANAAFVGAESISTPRASTLPPNEAGDLASHTPEGLPKVGSTAFFLIFLFIFSIGISYFFKCYVFSRDRKEWCCEKQSQSAVSPEAMGLKENTSRQNTPENGNTAKTGLYANIFARSYDSDEEEIRQLELEAMKADEESDTEFRSGKKPAKPSKASILKALETANHLPKLSIQGMNKGESAKNGTAVRNVADVWMDKALNKSDENKNIPGMTVVDVDRGSNMTNHHNNDNHAGLTSVVVHRDPSPVPSANLSVNLPDAETNANLSTERHEDESMSETPRTDISNGMLSMRPKSSHGDMDGYSTDFESISLYSELSNVTELQKSMDSRSVRANTARRKRPTHQNYVSTTNDNTAHEHSIPSKETMGDHCENHVVHAKGNAQNIQTDHQETYQDAESKKDSMRAEPQPQNDVGSGLWANKVTCKEASTLENGHSKKRAKDSNRSEANPTLATKSGQPSQAADVSNPQEESAIKASSEDDKPGTPESGTPLLVTDEVDTSLKQQDDISKEPADLGDAAQSQTGSKPVNIYAKYANNAKLPNKHILGDAEGNDRPSTSVKPKTPVKDNKEAEQKTLGSSSNKGAANKGRKSSAVSKPSDGTPRSKTSSRRPSTQKKRNAKR